MKKYIVSVLLAFSCCSILTSCTDREERQALRIYNDKSLDRYQKIDRLWLLYCNCYKKANNSVASQRAWDAIQSGDYQKAYAITQGYKQDHVNYAAQYYAKLLQEEMPAPNSFSLVTESSGRLANFHFACDYPTIRSNSPIDPGKIFYKVDCKVYGDNDYAYTSFDTGSSSNVTLNHSASLNMLGISDSTHLRFEIDVRPYTGWGFDYWNEKAKYKYTYDLADKTVYGTYTCTRVQ